MPLRRATRPRKRRKGKLASLGRQADALWSRLVKRDLRCTICGETGRLQAAHGISRRYRHTRWLLINGFSLCAPHHVYYTHRPLEWDNYLRYSWGQPVYDELRALALRTSKPDVAAALEALKAEAQRENVA